MGKMDIQNSKVLSATGSVVRATLIAWGGSQKLSRMASERLLCVRHRRDRGDKRHATAFAGRGPGCACVGRGRDETMRPSGPRSLCSSFDIAEV